MSDIESEIKALERELMTRYEGRMSLQGWLSRRVVSHQGNHGTEHGWFRYKEAFSAGLVESLLDRTGATRGALLDPFCGAGTALMVASARGQPAHGIELLPIGQEIVAGRLAIRDAPPGGLDRVRAWGTERPWGGAGSWSALPTLAITRGAYPLETADAISRYRDRILEEPEPVRTMLRFALLCCLEEVSFTRKDGQYLRWDRRARPGPGTRKGFDKGVIPRFDEVIAKRLAQVAAPPGDLFSRDTTPARGPVELLGGSALEVLPRVPSGRYQVVLTSPPYCNRYDYTRTYALELALLGVDERALKGLRQAMLTCTVENRAKDLVAMAPGYGGAVEVARSVPLLEGIVEGLARQARQGTLNNPGIPRMVRGYFDEMACVISESRRVLEPGGSLVMVNDNVRYGGISIPVDLILSRIAESLGFWVEAIWVVPGQKGNSSQQMGHHGRDPLRKCCYWWRAR